MVKIAVGDFEADDLLPGATQLWCLVFKDIKTNKMKKFYPGSPQGFIKEALAYMDTLDVLIMHNGIGYDWPLLKKLHGYDFKGRKVDTLIMSRLHNPKRLRPFNMPTEVKGGPHSVASWGYRVGRGKVVHEDWSKFTPAMLHRCVEDVEIQHLIYKSLRREAEGYNWERAYGLNFRLFELLQKQEEYGWLVDEAHIHRCIRVLEYLVERIDRAVEPLLPLKTITEKKTKGEHGYVKKPFKKDGNYSQQVLNWHDVAGISPDGNYVSGPFSRIDFRITDINSNNEVKEFLISEGWEPKEWNYSKDTGERTSAKLSKDDPFEGVDGSVGRSVARRVQCRQRKSILEGWLGLIREDGRIPSIINNLAVTGRATHRNIVNVPGGDSFFAKWMRKVFVAKEGWVLVGTDSDACQIRMLAGRMNDDEYTRTVLEGDKNRGTDIHSVNKRAAGLKSRADAKTFFYGFLFGAGDAKIGKIVGGSAADGKKLKEDFLRGLPALKTLIDTLTAEWKATAKKKFNREWNRVEYYNGTITGLDGRPIRIASEHQILVYMLQSDEAIMMAGAYCIFHKQMFKYYEYGRDFGTLCWYHDEWTVECRPEIAKHVGELAEEAIATSAKHFKIPCPHIGNAQIGRDWWEIH